MHNQHNLYGTVTIMLIYLKLFYFFVYLLNFLETRNITAITKVNKKKESLKKSENSADSCFTVYRFIKAKINFFPQNEVELDHFYIKWIYC